MKRNFNWYYYNTILVYITRLASSSTGDVTNNSEQARLTEYQTVLTQVAKTSNIGASIGDIDRYVIADKDDVQVERILRYANEMDIWARAKWGGGGNSETTNKNNDEMQEEARRNWPLYMQTLVNTPADLVVGNNLSVHSQLEKDHFMPRGSLLNNRVVVAKEKNYTFVNPEVKLAVESLNTEEMTRLINSNVLDYQTFSVWAAKVLGANGYSVESAYYAIKKHKSTKREDSTRKW